MTIHHAVNRMPSAARFVTIEEMIVFWYSMMKCREAGLHALRKLDNQHDCVLQKLNLTHACPCNLVQPIGQGMALTLQSLYFFAEVPGMGLSK